MKSTCLLFAVSVLTVLAAAGCQRTYKYPSQTVTVNPTVEADGDLNLQVNYTLANEGDQPVTYSFTSSKQFDAWLIVDGQEIARESKGRVYTQALTSFTLQPGASTTFTANLPVGREWRERAQGRYELHAGLVGYRDVTVVARIVVTEGKTTVIPK